MRVPAAWNDLVGLKTTHGAAAARRRRAALPALRHDRPARPIGRGRGAAPRGAGRPPAPDLAGAGLDGRGCWCSTRGARPTRTGPAAAFEAAVERLGAAGARVDRGRSPRARRRCALSACRLAPRPTAPGARRSRPPRGDVRAGPRALPPRRRISAADYVRAWARLDGLRAGSAAATAGYDAVLVPTTANLPPERRAPARRPGAFQRREPACAAQHPDREPDGAVRAHPADRHAELRPDGDAAPAAPKRGCEDRRGAGARPRLPPRKLLDPHSRSPHATFRP